VASPSLQGIEAAQTAPFDAICSCIEEAVGVMAPDPIQHVYKMIQIQAKLRKQFESNTDSALRELVRQADVLMGHKIEHHWDLLSLQDPKTASENGTTPLSGEMPKGTSIRDFAIKSLLGRGGFGTVWLAERKRTRALVAIKVLSKKQTTVRMMDRAVHLEKDILAQSDSPYVIKLFFSFSTANHLYMAMEYAPGGDVFALLEVYLFPSLSIAVSLYIYTYLGLTSNFV